MLEILRWLFVIIISLYIRKRKIMFVDTYNISTVVFSGLLRVSIVLGNSLEISRPLIASSYLQNVSVYIHQILYCKERQLSQAWLSMHWEKCCYKPTWNEVKITDIEKHWILCRQNLCICSSLTSSSVDLG